MAPISQTTFWDILSCIFIRFHLNLFQNNGQMCYKTVLLQVMASCLISRQAINLSNDDRFRWHTHTHTHIYIYIYICHEALQTFLNEQVWNLSQLAFCLSDHQLYQHSETLWNTPFWRNLHQWLHRTMSFGAASDENFVKMMIEFSFQWACLKWTPLWTRSEQRFVIS